jgi:UPF0755 protein
MKRALGVIAIVTFAAALFAGGVVIWGKDTFNKAGPLADETVLIIKRGAGLRTIAAQLENAGIIRYPLLFVAKAKWSDAHRDLKAGEYAFTPGTSPASVLAKIRKGNVIVHQITIPEGLTSLQAVALVRATPALQGNITDVPTEGSLLPETYDYINGDTRTSLILRMKKARENMLAGLWKSRAKGLPISDPQAASILASIVEKETGRSSERARVAAVFINRMRRGMRLQSDPTVVYALTGGKGPLGRSLTRTDLAVDNPFNTYVIKGLPPGPIANPGAASLAAVLQPAKTSELYFVADGTGGHAFAKTLREHNRNVARWRKLQRKMRSQSK